VVLPQHLFDAEHRGHGHPHLVQATDDLLVARQGGHPLFDDGRQLLYVLDALVDGVEAGVFRQPGPAHGLAEVLPVLGGDADDADVVLLALEVACRGHPGVVGSASLGLYGAAAGAVGLDVYLVGGEEDVQEAYLHVLPLAGALPVEEGGQDGAEAVDACHDVAQAQARVGRGAVGLAYHVGDAGVGLADVVEPGLVAEGAALPEGGDGTHDDAGVDLAHRFVIEAQPGDDPRREVLH